MEKEIKSKGINVLSLCDGMSCGQIALKELNIPVNRYYASEIDKNAIKVTMDNFPDTIQLGDVNGITELMLRELPKIDLVIFGFPCRSLSIATIDRPKYNAGLQGESGLFYPCNKILQWIKQNNNPHTYWMVENVDSNKTDDIQLISDTLGVHPMLIDSNLFSAQNRKRLYWTNIPVAELPRKNDQVLRDVMDTSVAEKYYYHQSFDFHGDDKKVCATLHINGYDSKKRINNPNFKSPTLTSCRGGNIQKKVLDNGRPRKLTPNEYRKLQTIPDWYRMDVADSHIYNMCGDGWTIEVIKHIFKSLKKQFCS